MYIFCYVLFKWSIRPKPTVEPKPNPFHSNGNSEQEIVFVLPTGNTKTKTNVNLLGTENRENSWDHNVFSHFLVLALVLHWSFKIKLPAILRNFCNSEALTIPGAQIRTLLLLVGQPKAPMLLVETPLRQKQQWPIAKKSLSNSLKLILGLGLAAPVGSGFRHSN